MSELDWLEREEKYRSLFLRTFVAISLVVAAALGVGSWRLKRQLRLAQEVEAKAAEAAAQAEASRRRAQLQADSTAASERVAGFVQKYGVQPLEGAPVLLVPVPHGSSIPRFLEQVWSEFTRVVDAQITPEKQREWFGLHYVDAMNMAWYNAEGHVSWQGEMQPLAVLLPAIRQKGHELEIEKPSFPQIVRGQETAGLRIAEVASDTTAMGAVPAEPSAPQESSPQEEMQQVPQQEGPVQGEASQEPKAQEATTAPKPQEGQPQQAKPQDTKPQEAKPQQAQPGQPQPVQPQEAKPGRSRR